MADVASVSLANRRSAHFTEYSCGKPRSYAITRVISRSPGRSMSSALKLAVYASTSLLRALAPTSVSRSRVAHRSMSTGMNCLRTASPNAAQVVSAAAVPSARFVAHHACALSRRAAAATSRRVFSSTAPMCAEPNHSSSASSQRCASMLFALPWKSGVGPAAVRCRCAMAASDAAAACASDASDAAAASAAAAVDCASCAAAKRC